MEDDRGDTFSIEISMIEIMEMLLLIIIVDIWNIKSNFA